MTEIIELVSIIVMASPTMAEILNDAHGDAHDKTNHDLAWRTIGTIAVSLIASFINHNHTFFQALCMSTAIFCAFFSYLVNYIELKNNVTIDAMWWNHLNDSSYPDKSPLWRAIPWQWRAVLYALILTTGIIIYVQ